LDRAMTDDLIILEELFAPAEMNELWSFAMDHEPDFINSQVVNDQHDSRRDDDYRRSRVLFDVADIYPLMTGRIREVLPSVLDRLGMAPFDITEIELQITASNDGEWFKPHRDSGNGAVRNRELTFVYYCHREPRQFSGGQLKMFGPFEHADHPDEHSQAQMFTPMQNSAVFFPSHYMHEVLTTHCPSRQFTDSRLTYNGWLHR
jgi:Rps23 Pro-64 3,4-dihydroxylase Tpa1-like proline 4-hydroxylase